MSSLRFKLVLLLALAVIPTALMLLRASEKQHALAQQEVRADVQRLADLLSLQAGQQIFGGRQLLYGLAQNRDIQDPARCNDLLAHAAAHQPDLANLGLITPDGQVSCSARPFAPATNLGDRDYFRHAMASGNFTVSRFITGRITRQPVVVLALPLRTGGRASGVLFAALDLAWHGQAEDALDRLLPRGAVITKIDPGGRVLGQRPAGAVALGSAFPEPAVLSAARSSAEAGVLEVTGTDGRHRLYGYAPIRTGTGAPGAYAIVAIPETTMLRRSATAAGYGSAGVVLLAGLTFLGVWLLAEHTLLRWVARLRRTTLAITAGDLTARTGPPYASGELGELARGFDVMADTLRARDAALRSAQARYRALVEQIPVITYVATLRPALRPTYLSPRVTTVLGFRAEEFLKDPDFWRSHIHPEDRERVAQAFSHTGQDHLETEYRMLHRDGSVVWLRDEAMRVAGGDGTEDCLQGVLLDITDRRQAEHALRTSEAKYRAVVESANEIIVVTRGETLLFVNAKAEAMLGYRREELVGTPFSRYLHPDDWTAMQVRNARRSQGQPIEPVQVLRVRDHAGRTHWLETSAVPIEWEGEHALLGFLTDITERVSAQEQLNFLASHDALTALPNRALFIDRANGAVRRAGRNRRHCAVMYIDLDRFQIINDTFGHERGDQALSEIAVRLRESLREVDQLARVAGDEFAVVLEDIEDTADISTVAGKLLRAIEVRLLVDEHELFPTGSIGIAVYPADGTDAQTLLRNAAHATDRAKANGKNTFEFYQERMTVEAQKRLEMDADLRHALEREEFLVYYQPKARLADGRLSGFEALLRWQHPQQGLMPPADFIPILEDNGMITAVGAWVMRSACEQVRTWQRQGLSAPRIAVNVSARQLFDRSLPDTVAGILADTGIAPECLELELTESMLMRDADIARRQLKAIKTLGLSIAIDDFGTGYSSLSHLRQFPIDVLKVDQAFVRDIEFDPDSFAIARTIIAMAHSLGMTAVAEGVETAGQLRLLTAEGCDAMQGYYFHRPLPAAAATILLQDDARLELPTA